MKNQKGFSIIITLIIVLSLFVVGGVGFYVYQRNLNDQNILPWQSDDSYNPCPPGQIYGYPPLPDAKEKMCMRENVALKPIIYLYPTIPLEVEVQLSFKGALTTTYPSYNNSIGGWRVKAFPSGKLINNSDGREYSYIFWEGKHTTNNYDMSKGFVIKGSDTEPFLHYSLSKLGLSPKEYNEMIVFWLPKMQSNKYNLIHFASTEYTDNAKLTIKPKPDSVLRVFMVYKALDEYQNIEKQELPSFERKGFTVVEWGGTELAK